MATSKEYAYYVKGNKIALVQKDWTFSGGQTLSQPGLNDLGTIGALLWKSPIEDITDGLEIEYVYSPQYMLPANSTINTNKFFINGWTVIDGYLTFLRSGSADATTNWTSSPESAVTSGGSGDTGGQTLDYIVVRGSSRWNGLHRVQTAGTGGTLKTYTKVNEVLPYWENTTFNFATTESIDHDSLYLGEYFSAGDYIFVNGSGEVANNGLFSVESVTRSSSSFPSTASEIIVGSKYFVMMENLYGSYPSFTLSDEAYVANCELSAETDQTDISLYKSYRDFCYILTDVNVLNDENDELDITRYQANAVTYYVKAKYAEDVGNIEMKEYFMREFRRMVEKHESSKVIGPRRLQGYNHFR